MNSELPQGIVLFPYPPHVAESVEDQMSLTVRDKHNNLRIQAKRCQKIVVRMHWRDIDPNTGSPCVQIVEHDITSYGQFYDWYHTHFVLPIHCTFTYHGL